MLENEKQHIAKAKKGNKESFSLLYEHHLPKIYRYVRFKVNGQSEAEDIAHEVFLSAWQNIRGYKYEGLPFSSWLYQIARNAVIDSYRTAKKNLPIEMVKEDLFEISDQQAEKMDTALEMNKVKKMISLLKPDYQDVIIMRFIEELSQEEIAAALNKSEGAIRLIQHRALKELKSLLENNKQNGTTIA